MLLPRWHKSIERIRPGKKTARGSVVTDWENAAIKTIEHCLVQPGGTMLSQDGRVLGIQDNLSVCAPADSDIKAGDRIRYDSKTYVIDGDPLIWENVGRLDYMQLTLKIWKG